MNKIVLGVVIVVVIGLGLWFYIGSNKSPAPVINTPTASTDTSSASATGTGASATVTQGTIKEFTVNGKNFSFSPSTINVRMGDKVKIIFKSDNGFHDLRIEGYDVGTSKVQTGEETSFEFTADKAGSFEYYCSVGSHRVNGMVGTLVVS